MRLRPIAGVVVRELYLVRGSAPRLLATFAWVAVDIVMWGFLTRYLNSFVAGFNFVPAMLGAVLMWDFFTRVSHGVAMTFLEDVWSRNFLNVFATPIRISEYLAGLVVGGIATSFFGLLVMVLMAGFIFGLSLHTYGAMAVPFLFVLLLCGIALGIAGTSVVLRFGPAAEWFIWPIPAIVSPFVGVFYPLATLPRWMQAIGRALPPSYVFENLRAIVAGQPASATALVLSTALAFGYVALACLLFARVHRHVVRTGLIARYSAESVS